MKPTSYRWLLVVVILSLALAACAPATSTGSTPVQTEPTAEQIATPTAEPTPEPTAAPSSIADIAVADGRFTTLVAALQAAGLAETLAGEGSFTVFAPTDDAFAALPEGALEGLLAEPEQLKQVLLYHVVDGRVTAADVAGLSSAATLQGEEIAVTAESGKVLINEAEVTAADIDASNGIIHVVDSVLLPPSFASAAEEQPAGDIVATAVADGRFTTLAAALEAGGLVEALQGEGPFTVFAPTDDAFAALPAGTLEELLKPENKQQLVDILTYHVVSGAVSSAQVVELTSAETLFGQPVIVQAGEDSVRINGAEVIITDVPATNGVIHVIDAVLLPPAEDLVGQLSSDERFSTLVAAVQAAGLAETLQGEGPFTVFAPTNEAFEKLPAGTVESLLLPENKQQLIDILTYHVVPAQVYAADVVQVDSAETVLGQEVTITVDMGKVLVNEAEVIETDQLSTNGVVHVIDSVILPAS